MGAQAWGIFPKVREVDDLMQARPGSRRIVREVHPEVSFWSWRGGVPMAHRKKSRDGRKEREILATQWLGPDVVSLGRGNHRTKQLATDDILDAIAALWTAGRILDGSAKTLPVDPDRDVTGIPMEIVY